MNTYLDSLNHEEKIKLIETLETLGKIFSVNKSFLIVGHIRPDGDCIGSAFGLAGLLNRQGKEAEVLKIYNWPSYMQNYFQDKLDKKSVNWKNVNFDNYDCFVVVDASSEDRFLNEEHGALEYFKSKGKPIVVIDHHHTNKYFGKVNLILKEAASTTWIITEMARYFGWEFDNYSAQFLAAGLITDTGGFVYKADKFVFETATFLADIVGDLSKLSWKLLQEKSYKEWKFLGAITNLSYLTEDKILVTKITKEFLKENDVSDETVGIVPAFVSRVKEANVIVVLSQSDEGIIVNFRTRTDFDVKDVAVALGGGGHKAASGCTIYDKDLDEAEKIVLEAVRKYVYKRS